VSDGPGSVGVVVLCDKSLGIVEDFHAEVVLLNGSIGETMLGDVLHESLFRVDSGALGRDGADFIALEVVAGVVEGCGVSESVASGRHTRPLRRSARAPGALGVGITRRFVVEDIIARICLG
jgi:hypothetical protein